MTVLGRMRHVWTLGRFSLWHAKGARFNYPRISAVDRPRAPAGVAAPWLLEKDRHMNVENPPVALITTSLGLALLAIALLAVYVARLHKRLNDQDARIMGWLDSMRTLYANTEIKLIETQRERVLWERALWQRP